MWSNLDLETGVIEGKVLIEERSFVDEAQQSELPIKQYLVKILL